MIHKFNRSNFFNRQVQNRINLINSSQELAPDSLLIQKLIHLKYLKSFEPNQGKFMLKSLH